VSLRPFQLHRPGSLEEATELLERHGEDAAPYCGATELVLLMKLGLADYRHLVDLKGIEELRRLARDDRHLHVGAAVTHRQIERSQLVRDCLPGLAEMEREVANLRVRNVGTLGGNLCFADPHSDPATFLLAADAELVCRRGSAGPRIVPIARFTSGAYETALEPGELLVGVRIPVPPAHTGLAHGKFAFHERPTTTVACLARVAEGRVAEARVAVGAVGPLAVRAPEAEMALAGLPVESPDPAVLEEAGWLAAAASGATSDGSGSAEYKRHLVGVLVRRCFRDALSRALRSTATGSRAGSAT
jgi:carbon-monoxide dehydrogenase medium subunit